MLKKRINYIDYNGVQRSEDFYFYLSKAEIMDMELETVGGFTAMVQKIIDAKDQPSLIRLFKDFILRAYGEKSPDGKRFIKSEELRTAFSQTEAYSNLYMELVLDDEKAAEFIKGIVPDDLREQLPANVANLNGVTITDMTRN